MTFWKVVGAVVVGSVVLASLTVSALVIIGDLVEACTKVPVPTPY